MHVGTVASWLLKYSLWQTLLAKFSLSSWPHRSHFPANLPFGCAPRKWDLMGLAQKTLSAQSLINFSFPWLDAEKHSDGGSCVLEMAEPEMEGTLAPVSPQLWESYMTRNTYIILLCWQEIKSYCVKLIKFYFSSKKDLFKKIRDIKGTFHAKMGTIRDRNCIGLTEEEDIKKR